MSGTPDLFKQVSKIILAFENEVFHVRPINYSKFAPPTIIKRQSDNLGDYVTVAYPLPSELLIPTTNYALEARMGEVACYLNEVSSATLGFETVADEIEACLLHIKTPREFISIDVVREIEFTLRLDDETVDQLNSAYRQAAITAGSQLVSDAFHQALKLTGPLPEEHGKRARKQILKNSFQRGLDEFVQ